jgi:hypothetical protein
VREREGKQDETTITAEKSDHKLLDNTRHNLKNLIRACNNAKVYEERMYKKKDGEGSAGKGQKKVLKGLFDPFSKKGTHRSE